VPPPTEPVSSTAVSQSLSTETVTVVACPVTPTSSAASSAAVAELPVQSAGLPIYQPPPPIIILSTPFQARTVVASTVANAMPSGPSTSTLRVRWP